MIRALLSLWPALFAIAAPMAQAQDTTSRYWSDTWRGWHFYEDPEPEALVRREATPKNSTSTPKPQSAKPPEIAEFERLQKAVEQTRTIAIMRPTEANVRRYMELEAKVVARASTFADMAQRVAWATPELDPTLQGRPVNAKALEAFEQQQISQQIGRAHV